MKPTHRKTVFVTKWHDLKGVFHRVSTPVTDGERKHDQAAAIMLSAFEPDGEVKKGVEEEPS